MVQVNKCLSNYRPICTVYLSITGYALINCIVYISFVNNELRKMWKEVDVCYFEALS